MIELFSFRQRTSRGGVSDVLQYDDLPNQLRVQIVHLLKDSLGYDKVEGTWHTDSTILRTYRAVCDALCREYGTFILPGTSRNVAEQPCDQLVDFVLGQADVEQVLDAVEICFRLVATSAKKLPDGRRKEELTSYIDELNQRFLRAGCGFQFEHPHIIRVDSTVLHAEVVVPALRVLSDPAYAGADQEFRVAHEHYRHERYEESLIECLKALESTMKVVCVRKKWRVDAKATVGTLISLMFDKGVIPKFWESHFSGLRSMLESGVPTVRNKQAGHGQGAEIRAVPRHFVAFALHQTAAAIVFLADAEKELP
ncbi:MAG: STM4504/CBY_0614 family protein [Lacipirellulaceae bacterium]